MTRQNSVSADLLRGFIERVESIRSEKKELSEQEKLIWAEVKAKSLNAEIMRGIIKRRTLKPTDIEEAEELRDMYLHALGMLPEPPLFRAVGLMGVDTMAKDSVLAALKQLVPEKGEIVLKIGGDPVRLFRNDEGEVVSEPYREPEPKVVYSDEKPKRGKKQAPAVKATDEEAEALGRAAYLENKPIISNPFPAGSTQRAKFDLGYRKESGGDGMGGE